MIQLELFPVTERPAPDGKSLQAIYDQLAADHGLPAARVVITMRRATGGMIRYGPPHLIRISGHMSESDQRETLLHEVAHAVCHARWGSREGHSSRFWAVAEALGVKRHSAPVTERLREVRYANARYVYRCMGCLNEWTRKKPFHGARLCASCQRKGRPARLILVRRPPRKVSREDPG